MRPLEFSLDEFIAFAEGLHPDLGPMFGRDAARVARELQRFQRLSIKTGDCTISLAALDALDAAIDLAVDVLDGTTSATTEDCVDLSRELCKARGMVLEARDPGEGLSA